MNDTTATSVPGASLIPDGTSVITTLHFAILAVLAALVILGIVWGVRLKRRRRAADRAIAAHNEEVEATVPAHEPAMPDATPAPRTAPPASEPPASEPPAGSASEPLATATCAVDPPRPPIGTAVATAPVTMLKGLGPKVAARLGELGVTSVGQLAALDDDAAAALDAQLGAFAGRMARDRWIEQARFLAAGDRAGFEAVFGKL